MMFTHRKYLDVLHHHHLVVADAEERAVEQGADVFLIALGEEPEGPLDALRSLEQALPVRILADCGQHGADVRSDGGRSRRSPGRGLYRPQPARAPPLSHAGAARPGAWRRGRSEWAAW